MEQTHAIQEMQNTSDPHVELLQRVTNQLDNLSNKSCARRKGTSTPSYIVMEDFKAPAWSSYLGVLGFHYAIWLSLFNTLSYLNNTLFQVVLA